MALVDSAGRFEPKPGAVVVGRYELVSELGRGGMGCVWRATNLAVKGPCALKFMLPEAAAVPDLRRRFEREAQAAAQLQSPHIVTVFDTGVVEDMPFMAMELLDGESLEARLEREGSLAPEAVVAIAAQVALGLEAAHARGLVHRDLKPENIFILRGEALVVKLLDFGVAKHGGATSGVQTAYGTLLGTALYMSPEQVQGDGQVDHRADVWALGVVVYRCLTGQFPYDGEQLVEVLGAVLHGGKPLHGFPELEAFWQLASARDPNARYQSATALVEGLREGLSRRKELATAATALALPSVSIPAVQPVVRDTSAGTDDEPLPAIPGRGSARAWLAGIALSLVAGLAYALWGSGGAAAPVANEPGAQPAPADNGPTEAGLTRAAEPSQSATTVAAPPTPTSAAPQQQPQEPEAKANTNGTAARAAVSDPAPAAGKKSPADRNSLSQPTTRSAPPSARPRVPAGSAVPERRRPRPTTRKAPNPGGMVIDEPVNESGF